MTGESDCCILEYMPCYPYPYLYGLPSISIKRLQSLFPPASRYLLSSMEMPSPERSPKRQKLTPESDYDGDSQMASSPESSSQPGTRTPTTNLPPDTNTNTPALTATGTAELSPPGSQQQVHRKAGGQTGGGVGMERSAPAAATTAAGYPQQQQQPSLQRRPGESWMNKRAEDDYLRAMESVVDKDFSLSKSASMLPPSFGLSG